MKELVTVFNKADSSAPVTLNEIISALKEGLTFTYQRGWLPLLELLSNLCLHLRSLLASPIDPTTKEAMFILLKGVIRDAVQLHHQESGARASCPFLRFYSSVMFSSQRRGDGAIPWRPS